MADTQTRDPTARVSRSAVFVAAGILVSRLAGLVRVRAFSHYFGLQSDAADAFNAATVGYFTISYRFQETAPIPFGATADQVRDALTALSLMAFFVFWKLWQWPLWRVAALIVPL